MPNVDLNSMWNQYQKTNDNPYGVRDFTSMDDVEVFDAQGRSSRDQMFEDGVSTNDPSYRSPWAVKAAEMGRIANDDASIARASQEIARTGRLLYQQGSPRTFDAGVTDSYDLQDPAKRAAGQAASDAGHAAPSRTVLGPGSGSRPMGEWHSVLAPRTPPPPSPWIRTGERAPYRPTFSPREEGGSNFIDQILGQLLGGRRQ